MEEIEKETAVENSPLPVTIECTNVILKQLMNCTFKIENSKGNGTGFFCSINEKIKVLITNNHVINLEMDKIIISINNDNEMKEIELDNRIKYTNKEYDITIIEIKNEDEINNYLELDDNIFNEYIKRSVCSCLNFGTIRIDATRATNTIDVVIIFIIKSS